MAQKRMFTMKIVDSDAFLDMPLSSQCLYFHLNMRADDDGFIGNPKKIMRMIGASEDDLKILLAKRFLLIFEDSVVVVKHWWMHNTLAKDRYHETSYTDEKALLKIKDNKAYTLGPEGQNIKPIENDVKMLTECNQNVNSDLDLDIVLDKDKAQENLCVPSYIKQKEIIPKKEDVKIVEEIYNLLNDFNRSTPKHKIPISKGLFNFQCKEGREVLHLMEQDCPENIVQALKNYLIVANMDSWKTSFSFNAFCKSYAEYTTEFFDITKYDKETDADAICDNFIKLMESRYPKEFDTGAFWQHRADWLQKGRPQDKKYFEWQNEIYKIMD